MYDARNYKMIADTFNKNQIEEKYNYIISQIENAAANGEYELIYNEKIDKCFIDYLIKHQFYIFTQDSGYFWCPYKYYSPHCNRYKITWWE